MTLEFDLPAAAPTEAGEAQVISSSQHRPRGRTAYRAIKRCIDMAVALIAIPLLLPLMGFVAALVRLDGGPALYSQDRIGEGGRIFRLWKFRSMVPDAEAALQVYLAADPQRRSEWDHAQKLCNDPRVTRIGRFLRKYSVDELPQLWNILVGDMSLVGPRPMFESQRELYPAQPYHGMRPGLTGLWQISRRNAGSFAERAVFDETYARSICLRTDLGIILRTVRIVFLGTGS